MFQKRVDHSTKTTDAIGTVAQSHPAQERESIISKPLRIFTEEMGTRLRSFHREARFVRSVGLAGDRSWTSRRLFAPAIRSARDEESTHDPETELEESRWIPSVSGR